MRKIITPAQRSNDIALTQMQATNLKLLKTALTRRMKVVRSCQRKNQYQLARKHRSWQLGVFVKKVNVISKKVSLFHHVVK